MRTLIIFWLCCVASANAEVITWEMGGTDWSGKATFQTGPPDFISPDGGLKEFYQPIDNGYSFEADFGNGYSIKESGRYSITMSANYQGDSGRFYLGSAQGMTDLYYQGDLVGSKYLGWGLRLWATQPNGMDADEIPRFFTDEQLQNFGLREMFYNFREAERTWDLPTARPPSSYDVTYMGGATIPEPSTWALCALAIGGFVLYRRRRNRCRQSQS